MVNTIFFDLDDTLLDFTRAEAAALKRALTELNVPAGEEVLARYHVINRRQWELLEEGVLTRDQVLVSRFEILFRELGAADCTPEEAADRYEGYLAQGHIFLPGAPELLEALAPRYDLYLASNGAAAVQHSRLKSAGIIPYFKGIFISEEVGYNKPRPEFFARCFAAIPGFDRSAAVMVGDSLTSDIRGGRGAGLRTVWFNPGGGVGRPDIRPDYEIARLDQLPSLLESL